MTNKTISSPGEVKKQERIARNLVAVTGTAGPFEFVQYVRLNNAGNCQASGGQLQKGVRLRNIETGTQILTGVGVAEKYVQLSSEFPTMSEENTVAEDAPEKVVPTPAASAENGEAPKKRGRKPKASAENGEVVEVEPLPEGMDTGIDIDSDSVVDLDSALNDLSAEFETSDAGVTEETAA